jgi:bifunctional DNA-binding transcriptional regulator/antitoxin component of YhaV-PrlF toxin-antitoxin module
MTPLVFHGEETEMETQTAMSPTEVPQRIDQGWIVAMPKEIAELFGVPVGSLVTLFVREGSITALMNLASQREEAKKREPGWILKIPSDIAAALGTVEGSIMVIYAKAGTLTVEVIPAKPEIQAAAQRLYNKYKEEFEELKRLGD